MSCEGRRVGGPLVLEGGRNEQMVPFLHHVCCLPNILLGEAGKAWRCGNSSAKLLCHIKRTPEFQSNMQNVLRWDAQLFSYTQNLSTIKDISTQDLNRLDDMK